jgi:hypothetical protein
MGTTSRAAIDVPNKTANGISSAVAVGSVTLGPFDEMPCAIGIARLPDSPKFLKTGFVKNLSKSGPPVERLVCGTFVKRASSP